MSKNFENSIVGKTRIRQFRDEPVERTIGTVIRDQPKVENPMDVVFIDELDSFDDFFAVDKFGMFNKDRYKKS